MMNLSVSDRLHMAAAPVWEKCLKHPFVTGIGDGTLDVEKFKFFIPAFARPADMHKRHWFILAHGHKQVLECRMRAHISLRCERHGKTARQLQFAGFFVGIFQRKRMNQSSVFR